MLSLQGIQTPEHLRENAERKNLIEFSSALLFPRMHAGREDSEAIAPNHLTTVFTDNTDTNK
jgi:hypothetical protein